MFQQAVQAAICILNAVQDKKMSESCQRLFHRKKERGEEMDVRKKPPQNKGVLWNKHPQQDWDVISPMKNSPKSPCEHSTVNSLYGKSAQC